MFDCSKDQMYYSNISHICQCSYHRHVHHNISDKFDYSKYRIYVLHSSHICLSYYMGRCNHQNISGRIGRHKSHYCMPDTLLSLDDTHYLNTLRSTSRSNLSNSTLVYISMTPMSFHNHLDTQQNIYCHISLRNIREYSCHNRLY